MRWLCTILLALSEHAVSIWLAWLYEQENKTGERVGWQFLLHGTISVSSTTPLQGMSQVRDIVAFWKELHPFRFSFLLMKKSILQLIVLLCVRVTPFITLLAHLLPPLGPMRPKLKFLFVLRIGEGVKISTADWAFVLVEKRERGGRIGHTWGTRLLSPNPKYYESWGFWLSNFVPNDGARF